MRTLVALLVVALVASCATPQGVGSKKPIPVSKVANDLKCELTAFLKSPGVVPQKDDIFKLDPDQWASGTLTLKTVTTNTYKASIGTAGVLPLGSGSIAPSLSFTAQPTSTVSTEIPFVLQQKLVAGHGCPPGHRPEEDYVGNFSKLLLALAKQQKEINSGSPYFGVRGITLSTEFGVEWSGDLNATVTFVPLTISPDVAASRNDTQHLEITFRTGLAEQPLHIKEFRVAGRPGGSGPGVVKAPPTMSALECAQYKRIHNTKTCP